MKPSNDIAALARAQHGLITREQLIVRGVPRRTADEWVKASRLERVHPSVYRVAGAPESWEQRAMAAALACNGVVSHRAAARLWEMSDGDEVEVVVAWGHPRLRGVTAHRSTDIEPGHVTTRRGIPVTNPMRTLVDLGAVDGGAVSDALERAVIARVCSIVAVERVLDDVARRGRRGAGVIRGILDERALGRARPDGLLEARFARLLREHGLPTPEFQYRVGRWVLDFAYPPVKLAIEVDGHEVHGTPLALQRDLARQNDLVAKGWTVLRFTWLDVVRRPERIASQTDAVLASLLSRAA